MRRIALFAIVSASLVVLGAGCSWSGNGTTANPPSSSAGTYGQLHQPADAKAPTQQPVIPPGAEKVPKPY